jgi:hypothetical protein
VQELRWLYDRAEREIGLSAARRLFASVRTARRNLAEAQRDLTAWLER